MHTIGFLRGLALAAGICLLAAPSLADIASFKAAVQAHDYKQATAEARETWPTLDKARADLSGIAREFGLAAYLASDFVASEFFAGRAIAAGSAESEALRLDSELLLQMSKLRLNGSKATRDKVHAALEQRSSLPDVGLVAYYAADAIMSYAFGKAEWREVESGAALSRKIAALAGNVPAGEQHRISLRQEVAAFLQNRDQRYYDSLDALRWSVIADISAAPDDVAAKSLVDVYWDVAAWQDAVRGTLYALYRLNIPDAEASAQSRIVALPEGDRAVRLLNFKSGDTTCSLTLTMANKPNYPLSAGLRGISGAVYLQVDIDEAGRASNGKILAAVPSRSFGEAVLLSMPGMRYARGDTWGPDCEVARKGRVAAFAFSVR